MVIAHVDPVLDVATILLCLVTAGAAAAAFFAVRAANRATGSAEKSAERQLAVERLPVLADVPQDLLDQDSAGDPLKRVVVPPYTDLIAISAPMRNVGRGPAFIISACVAPANRSKRPEFDGVVVAYPIHRVLPPGETTQITCSVKRQDRLFGAFEEAVTTQFNVLVRYTDLAGVQRRVTNLYVVPFAPGGEVSGHIATGVEVAECDEEWREVGDPVIARIPLDTTRPPEPDEGWP